VCSSDLRVSPVVAASWPPRPGRPGCCDYGRLPWDPSSGCGDGDGPGRKTAPGTGPDAGPAEIAIIWTPVYRGRPERGSGPVQPPLDDQLHGPRRHQPVERPAPRGPGPEVGRRDVEPGDRHPF